MYGKPRNIQEYEGMVKQTMQHWLNIHTNARQWAEAWSLDGDWLYTYKESPVISNNYFTFDLRAHVTRQIAKRTQSFYFKCKCGIIWGNGDYCDQCQNAKEKKVSINELAEWLSECEIQPDAQDIENAMIQEGFKVYRAALKDTTHSIESELKDCLKQLQRAKSLEQKIQALTWANHIAHVNGMVIRDYGEQFGLDYKFVERVSQEGIGNVFDLEAA